MIHVLFMRSARLYAKVTRAFTISETRTPPAFQFVSTYAYNCLKLIFNCFKCIVHYFVWKKLWLIFVQASKKKTSYRKTENQPTLNPNPILEKQASKPQRNDFPIAPEIKIPSVSTGGNFVFSR